uniref:Pathogenesis-related protein 1 n=1 Tax=Aegilops tauschii TaxID=37682 RepID=R7VZ14_AEGTA
MASTDSWTHEIESPVAAARLFRAGVMDWHTLAPKLAPHIVASAHPVEGEGGIGSVRQFNFTSDVRYYLTSNFLTLKIHGRL